MSFFSKLFGKEDYNDNSTNSPGSTYKPPSTTDDPGGYYQQPSTTAPQNRYNPLHPWRLNPNNNTISSPYKAKSWIPKVPAPNGTDVTISDLLEKFRELGRLSAAPEEVSYVLRFREEPVSFETDMEGGKITFNVGKLYVLEKEFAFYAFKEKPQDKQYDRYEVADLITIKKGAALMYLGYRPTINQPMVYRLYFLFKDQYVSVDIGGPRLYEEPLVPHSR